MKFIGVVMIVVGVATAATIIGILIAWLPIWLGVLLFQASQSVDRAYAQGNEELLHESLGKLKTFFVVYGVVVLLYVAFLGIALLFGGLAALAALFA